MGVTRAKQEKAKGRYRPAMAEKTVKKPIAIKEGLSQPAGRGAGFLLWGLIFVTVLNLGMVLGSLVLFAP